MPPSGAPWNVLERDLRDGVGPSVERLLQGKSREGTVPDGFTQVSAMAAEAAITTNDPERLKAWWIYRMLFGPDPLGERLTLMWHNHFATSNAKVNNLALMRRQNEAFRGLARGLRAICSTPRCATRRFLIWLDAPSNRREHPNENLARELMELFTLGIGHFSEADVKQAARTLTGWTVKDQKSRRGSRSTRRRREGDSWQTRKLVRGGPGQDSAGEPRDVCSPGVAHLRHVSGRRCRQPIGD